MTIRRVGTALRRYPVALALGGLGLSIATRAVAASPVVTEVRLGGVEGHFVVDIVSTEALKYAQVESGSEPFTLTFYLLDAILAFPAVTRDVGEGPLKQVTATVLQRDESRVARLDLVFERLVPFRVAQDDKRLTVHLREPAIATRVVLRGAVDAAGDPILPAEMPRATAAPVATLPPAPPPPGGPPGSAGRPPGPVAPRVTAPGSGGAGAAAAAGGGSTTSSASPPGGAPPAPGSPVTPPPLPAMPTLPRSLPTPPPSTAGPSPAPSGTGIARGPAPVQTNPGAPPAPGAGAALPPIRAGGGTTSSIGPSAAASAGSPTVMSTPPSPSRSSTALARPRAAGPATRVTRLALIPATLDTQVRIVADGRLSYRSFVLKTPARLVVDLDGVSYRLPEPSLALEGGPVERVRAARFRSAPAEVVRVVFDLRKAAPHWVEAQDDGIIVHIGSAGPGR